MAEQDYESRLMTKIARGEAVYKVEEMTEDYKQCLIHLLLMHADSELAAAFGYVPWITKSVSTKEMLRVASIVHDEVRHARVIYKLLEDLGVDTDARIKDLDLALRVGEGIDLGSHRAAPDLRMNIFFYPIMSWSDYVVFSALSHRAARHQLFDVSLSSYGPWRDVIEGILREEEVHVAHADFWLKRMGHSETHQAAAQEALDIWFPRALAIFGSAEGDQGRQYHKYGLRVRENHEVRRNFVSELLQIVMDSNLRMPKWDAFAPVTEGSKRN